MSGLHGQGYISGVRAARQPDAHAPGCRRRLTDHVSQQPVQSGEWINAGPQRTRLKHVFGRLWDLVYLTGYMAVDEGLHGLAQRYYVKALELAGAAGDHLTYCTTLRGMSVQAVDLRHGAKAMELADAAAAASPKAGPRMRAFLVGQQAHAAAQTGDRTGALRYIREAEAAMDRAESRGKAFGSYDPSSLNYHVSQVRYELGDRIGAVEAMQQADRLRPSVYQCTRVHRRGLLAERQLELGHLEAACATWHQALDDYPKVQSGRADDRVKAMVGLLRPHLKNTAARDLYERARTIAPPPLVA
ncbi:transcriptional regulator [Streptomyces sp. NPDC048277]|uniref:transcriptional regulator n=1 Tax=Streptomyces sp. NPDC048277 TaxID=3155027 RepID=UPI0033E8FDA5